MKISFVNRDGTRHDFVVEIARTLREQRLGLQHRAKPLGSKEGMLFDFPMPRPVFFWMRDVAFPLDMIFVGPNGEVTGVTEASEDSDEPHHSPGPVRYVVEVARGRARALGIEPGSRLTVYGAQVRGLGRDVVASSLERPMNQLLTLGADVLGNATARAFPSAQIYPFAVGYQLEDGENVWGADAANLPPAEMMVPAYNEPPAFYEWPGLAAQEGFPQISSLALEALPLSGSYNIPVAPLGWGFRRTNLWLSDPYVAYPPSLIGT